MTDKQTLLALAERVAEGSGISNALDVKIEVAKFVPDGLYVACRANAAGTKIIYTDRGGRDKTCWAWDWTMDRKAVAADLRARAGAMP